MSPPRQLRRSKRWRSPSPQPTAVLVNISGPVNTHGLLCLPDELFLEIVSHFPAFPIPTLHNKSDIAAYGGRRLLLDTLSQTCRSLRRVLLRYRWRRIEVYQKMDLGNGPLRPIRYRAKRASSNMKDYVVELLRQLETVTIREPALAEFVNVLDIVLADYSTETVVPELARCMALMPNLHTVQIHFDIYKGGNGVNLIEKSFSSYSFPHIRRVHLTENALYLLRRCPAVKGFSCLKPLRYEEVRSPRWSTPTSFFTVYDTVSACSNVDSLGPIYIGNASPWSTDDLDLTDFILLIEPFVNLRDVTLRLSYPPTSASLHCLWAVQSLKTIRLTFKFDFPQYNKIYEWRERVEDFMMSTSANTTNSNRLIMEFI